ncbi:MAG: Hfq-related RNA-binding protein [Cyanobacteriota bacterium]
METLPLDPSLPGVRQLQTWIRQQSRLRIDLGHGHVLEGVLQWQDPEFLALKTGAPQVILINRRAVLLMMVVG